MTAFDVMLARLLLAAAGSLAAGCTVWTVALVCARRWPALAQQRSLWLLGQAAVAAVFVAMLLPHSERLHVAPVIVIGDSAPPPSFVPVPRASTAAAPMAVPRPATTPRGAWLTDAARVWPILYLLGLGHAVFRQRKAQRMLNALRASGQPLTVPAAHAGFAAHIHAALPAVIEIEASISPMLQGLFKPRLLLPRHLRDADPLQQQLIVEHELTHWRRHDLHLSAAALALQTLFWFNPFMRMLRLRLGWAQEFGCDREVLRGRPHGERKAYAAALVAQLKLQRLPAGGALAFGASTEPTLAARITLIRAPAAAPGIGVRWAALGALAAVAAANLALQPTLARNDAGMLANTSELLARAWPRMASAAPAWLDCTVMVDAASGAALVHEGSCDEHVTPGSTFKIAISLMGFDSGVLRDDRTPYLPYRPSYAPANPATRHDADPAAWLRESIVWYSQQVTARLGADAVRNYVQAFDYGNRELASVPGVDDAIALSEISPTLRISPLEQTVFLRKVVNRSLPVSARAYDVTARLLKLDAPVNGWEVYGKTGTVPARRTDGSADETQDIGWFVGWASKGGRTVVFARLLQHRGETYHRGGALTRAAFLDELAKHDL